MGILWISTGDQRAVTIPRCCSDLQSVILNGSVTTTFGLVLLHQISILGRSQMPQLATSLVDQQAVKRFRESIKSLNVEE